MLLFSEKKIRLKDIPLQTTNPTLFIRFLYLQNNFKKLKYYLIKRRKVKFFGNEFL